MVEDKQIHPLHQLTLYVCSGCEGCGQAAAYLLGWTSGREDVQLEIVSIADLPEQVVRLGINHTPALVIDDELLAQEVSVDSLTELLWTRLNEPGASPQPVS